MIVHGKERNLKLTIGASLAISEICPDGDLARLEECLTGSYSKVMQNVIHIILALQAGAEDARALDDPGYTPDYMTAAELETLEPDEFKELERAAIVQYKKDTTPTVKTTPKKK